MDKTSRSIAEFSLHDEAQMQNPYPIYDEVRSRCPMAHSDELGGFYFVTRYDEAKTVYKDFRTFSSRDGTGLPAQPVEMYPIDLDPPQQTKYRRILNPAFTPEAVGKHRPRIEAIVRDLIDEFIADGAAELGAQLIRPTLSATVLPILGVPLSDQRMISANLDYLVRHRADDPVRCNQIGQEMAGYLMGISAARRTAEPQNDILQTLLAASIDGAQLTDDTIFRVLLIILFGGLDTTSAAISEALLHLARSPDDAARLREGQVPWATAIEEFIRYTSPIQGLRRTVITETELGGVMVKPGEFILSLNGAANRDPERFVEPHRCIIDREMEEHLAFGAGAHVCLGRDLARLVMDVMLRALLERIPDYTVPNEFVPEYAAGEARGMKRLPVTFTPGRRSAG